MPKRTLKAICNPCKTCSKCLDCTGAITCGCVDACESCAKKVGGAVCDCTKATCRILFCTIPKKVGQCACYCG